MSWNDKCGNYMKLLGFEICSGHFFLWGGGGWFLFNDFLIHARVPQRWPLTSSLWTPFQMPYLVNATFPSSRPAPPKKPIDSWVLSLLSAMYFTNLNPNAPCMEYLPTVYIYIYVPQICGKPIGNYSLHGASLGKGFCGALTARPHPSTQQPNNPTTQQPAEGGTS